MDLSQDQIRSIAREGAREALQADDTRAVLRAASEEAAELGVARAMQLLGVDIKDPKEIREMQADLIHLRSWRTASNSLKDKTIAAAIVVVVSGMLAALWIGIKGLVAPH
ncbi:MAG: hypothetical protein ABII76_22825 [Pseudomonadota bacterium]